MNIYVKGFISGVIMFISAMLVLLAIALVFFIVFGLPLMAWNHAYCETVASMNPEYNFQWIWNRGCMIQNESGLWIPLDQVVSINGGLQLSR